MVFSLLKISSVQCFNVLCNENRKWHISLLTKYNINKILCFQVKGARKKSFYLQQLSTNLILDYLLSERNIFIFVRKEIFLNFFCAFYNVFFILFYFRSENMNWDVTTSHLLVTSVSEFKNTSIWVSNTIPQSVSMVLISMLS